MNDTTRILHALEFRPERSRQVWKNKHTGTEVTVLDLGVDDNGGFQGGCRRHTVTTNEKGPPGFRTTRKTYSLSTFIEHWEPTGTYLPVDEIEELTDEDKTPQRSHRERMYA